MKEHKPKYRLIIFDMDGTLLNGRTIFKIAEEKGFENKLNEIMKGKMVAYKKTIEIAKLLRCIEKDEFLEIFRKIPLNENAKYVVNELKKIGMKIAIATDSYQIAAMDLKNRLGIDYVFSNEIVIKGNHLTGEIILNNKNPTKKFEGCKIHSICKRDILFQLCKDLKIGIEETIAVGDGKVDICMIKEAGLGIAFNAEEDVRKNADVSINNLTEILKYVA